MNRFFKSAAYVVALVAILTGCGEDDDKPAGSDERSIIAMTFEGQYGNTTITRTADNAEVSFQWNTATPGGDLSKIKVTKIDVSKDATCSVKVGDELNFNNSSKSVTVTVTAQNGTPLNWTVKLTEYTPDPGSGENDITAISFEGQIGDAVINN